MIDLIVDLVAIFTIPVAFLVWLIGNIKINNDAVRRIDDLYKSGRDLYL